MLDASKISFGAELEWSDIDRRVDIPVELGEWEGPKIAGYYVGSEIDIVNTKGRWRGHGTDPLSLTCPVGGEIHVQPTYTIESQLIRIMRIMNLFPTVCVACPNHGHIHVGLPGIKGDLEALKNIFKYTEANELDLMKTCCGYTEEDHGKIMNSKLDRWVKDYLLIGDGKKINTDLYRTVEKAESVSEILEAMEKITAIDYDWVSETGKVTENSHRTALNLYNLTKGETVEFRIFRASTNPVEIYSSLRFCKRFIEEALKGEKGKSVLNILKEGNFKFAKLNFDEDLARGWSETRSSKGRCAAFKHYMGTCIPSEDLLWEETLVDDREREDPFEDGLFHTTMLCIADFTGQTVHYFEL